MKITLFTSNHNRHNYLVNLMADISEQLCVIQENKTTFPVTVPGHYPASNIMKKYFSNVTKAQTKMFEARDRRSHRGEGERSIHQSDIAIHQYAHSVRDFEKWLSSERITENFGETYDTGMGTSLNTPQVLEGAIYNLVRSFEGRIRSAKKCTRRCVCSPRTFENHAEGNTVGQVGTFSSDFVLYFGIIFYLFKNN